MELGGMGMGGYRGGSYGQPMGIGGGLAAGLDALMRHRLEMEEANRYRQQVQWMQNPNNPENILRRAQAKEALALSTLNTSKSGTTGMGALFQLMGKPIPKGVDPNAPVNAQSLAMILSRMGGGNSGIIQRGMASVLRGVMNSQEQYKIDSLPGALALHNRVTTIMDAYNRANGDAGLATRLIQQEAAKNPIASSIAQSIGGDPSKLAATLNSTERQLALETYKIVNGSTAAPSEQTIRDTVSSYPQLGDSPVVVAEKLNTILESQLKPAMQGPIGRLEAFRDAQGNYPVELYKTVHDNLVNQLNQFGPQVKGLGQFTQDTGGNIDTNLIPQDAGTPKPSSSGSPSSFVAGPEAGASGAAPVAAPTPIPTTSPSPLGAQAPAATTTTAVPDIDALLAQYRASKPVKAPASGGSGAAQP